MARAPRSGARRRPRRAPAVVSAPDAAVRARLLRVAARRFISSGYLAVTMEQVARDARVSKSTLYKVFGSKDALYAAVVQEAVPRRSAELPRAADGEDLRAALESFGRNYLAALTAPASLELMRGVIAQSARFPELAERFFRSGPQAERKRLAAWLEELGAQGRVRVDDPRVAADLFVGMIRDAAFTRVVFGLRAQGREYQKTIAAAADAFVRLYGA